MKANILLITILVILTNCSPAPAEPYVMPEDALQLIAGPNSKTWKLAKRTNDGNRMNMGDCFLSYRQTFNADHSVSDNNGEHRNCGESLIAKWELVKDENGHNFIKLISPQLPELMNIKDDFKMFKVLHLAEDKMKLSFYHKQFSDRTTTIIDYLVPEDIIVEDRDFHW